ncbi:sugar ABC transporter substrate-binding protein [Metarhizobium album]|uniref:Sugar ABC transporter substrate-binding protein n=1 Tax=Metarhizobium album TaxID=2182425 RepID=A0A2U2DJ98_9HYPH|nr:ABC transporter substrate-binding protein [Rhizobium album]PWE53368.1 sugar ABC transporter substrate-binding protein [Rhizobium album]
MKVLLRSALAIFAAVSVTGQVAAEGLDELSPDVAAYYQGLDPEQPTGASAYRDFKPRKGPPWTIGYASSYAGNTYRAAAMDRLMKELLPKYKEAGLVNDVIVTQSNLNDATQIQQIRQLVDQGADAIILCCSNPVALNRAVEYAYRKGVPVINWSGYLTSPYSINASANYTDGGYQVAKQLIEETGGKGNFLLVSGIPGAASSESFDNGARKALAEFPEVKLVGQVAGNWTDQIAQTEVQKWLATNSVELAGIITQGAQETGVLKAVLQSGRKVMPMSQTGAAGPACYMKKNPEWLKYAFHMWPPADEMELGFNVLMRTLQGQGPKVQSIIRSVYRVSAAEYTAKVSDDCSIDDPSFVEPGISRWFPDERAADYFLHPSDPLTWKPTN